MKLLIGIMHTIENEFEQCIEAIKSQTHQDFDYFVIENLPNKEAHDTLYKTFMDNAREYDLFIKIDADMVLARPTFFEEVIEKMQSEPDIDDLQIAVHDFYTNTLIYGLHVYKSSVTWNITDEKYFVDRIENIKKRVNDKKELAPAAFHCPNPSHFQSFHYGLHKAVKVMQRGRSTFDDFSNKYHWNNILAIKEHYKREKNVSLAFAILGAYISIKKKYSSKGVNYNNTRSNAGFLKFRQFSEENLHKKVDKAICFFEKKFILERIIFKQHYNKMWAIKRFIKAIIKRIKL